ncbi:MAG: TetR/AcrR family transcriptional regulator [Pseudomonadota bacterium]
MPEHKPAHSRSQGRISDRHSTRLHELIIVATRLFNRNGVLATRMEEIAESLGTTPGNLYHYVKSKEELAYRCYLRSCEVRRSQLQIADEPGTTGLQKIEAFFRQLLVEGQSRTAVLGEIGVLKPEWANRIRRLQRDNTAAAQNIIASGIEDGSIRPSNPFLTGIGILGIVEWISYWYTNRLPYTRDEVTVAMLDIVTSGVTAHRPYDVNLPKMAQPFPALEVPDPFDKDAMAKLKLQHFLRAAMHAFNRDGVKATSIDKLARQLNVTKGAFYHYFDSKEELLYRCYERAIEFNNSALLQETEDYNQREVLTRRSLFERHVSELGPFPVYTNVKALEGVRQKQVMRELEATQSSDQARIRAAIEAGELRQVDPFIAEKVRAGLINWFPIWYSPNGRATPTEVADNHSDLFLNGIRKQA